MERECIIECFDKYGCDVHIPHFNGYEKERKAIIFSHILKAGGSQVAIEKIIPLLNESGYDVYIVSHEDGVFRNRFVELHGAVVVIQKSYDVDGEYRRFLQTSFDLVMLNSNASGAFAYYFINVNVPVLWWMHECVNMIASDNKKWIPHHNLTSNNFVYIFPWIREVREFKEVYGKESLYMPIGISDTYVGGRVRMDKVRFLIPGAYMGFKGFPYVLNAIMSLPSDIMLKCEFTFCGYVVEEALYDKMVNLAREIPYVNVLGEISYEEMMAMQCNADCIIVPSLVDAGPLVAVEALMKEKICIISDKVGVAEYLTDCYDAFVYNGDSIEELARRILFVATEMTNLDSIRHNARVTYENSFSEDEMKKAWKILEKRIRNEN